MSDGFYFWYTGVHDRGGVERVLRVLERRGVHLAHPVSRVITAITDGPDSWGEQIPLERAELIGRLTLTDRTEVNFQFWLNEQTDLFTRFRRLADEWLVVEFGLDGMLKTEQELAVEAISHAVDDERESTWGLVIDRSGLTEDTDWDAVMLGQPAGIAGWPDVLGVRPEVVARHPPLQVAQGAVEPPLMVYRGDVGG
ncbi:hypothetical protein L1I79_12730 [Strepomyces sp. STD 3.1]|nr:hypothetical protein [Streptomyces sp. STD 3.1]